MYQQQYSYYLNKHMIKTGLSQIASIENVMSIMCLLVGELLVFLLEVARCRFAQKSPNKEVRTDSLQRFTSNSQRQAAQTAPFTPMSEPTIICFLMQWKVGQWFSLFMTPKKCEHSCKFDVSKNPYPYIYNTKSQFLLPKILSYFLTKFNELGV